MSQISKITYGGDLMLFIASGVTTVQPLAFATSAKLDITLKTRDVGSKDSGYWDEKAPAKFGFTVGSDNLMAMSGTTGTTQTFAKLYTMFISRTPVNMAFAAKAGSTPSWTASSTNKFTGSVLITALNITAGDNANATYTMAGEGTGILSFA